MDKTREKVGIPNALFAALCFAFIPYMVTKIYDNGVNLLTLLSLRYILASLVLIPIVLFIKRFTLPPIKAVLKIMLVSGIFFSLEVYLFFQSLTILPTSLAILILFTFPLFTNVFLVFSHKKPKMGSWISMIICLIGLSLLLGTQLNNLNIIGIIYAFLAAISYAIFLILEEKLIKNINPLVANTIITLANAITFTAAAIIFNKFSFDFNPSAWNIIIILVVVSNIIGLGFLFNALKLLGPQKTSMLNITEPVFTILIAVVLLGETFSLLQFFGAFILIIGLIVFMLFNIKHKNLKLQIRKTQDD